jgi:ubiquitin-conjugating enzyme E2 Q
MPCKSTGTVGDIAENHDCPLSDDLELFNEEDDAEDISFLFSDDEFPESRDKGKGKGRKIDDDMVMQEFTPPPKRKKSMTDFVPGLLDKSSIQLLLPPSNATSAATRQLQRELKTILAVQDKTPLDELGWYIDRDFVENVFQWIVELHSFDENLPLAKDMKDAGVKSVVLEIRFGKDYPISPPFVRVIRPRFLPFMSGGGGHITAGGAMCMELLTNSGWSAASSLESVLLQIRLAMSNLDPKPARLENRSRLQSSRDYGVGEAMEAYVRACQAHNWEVPKDFKDFSSNVFPQ